MLRPSMAGGIDGEISKLRHRDVRERRRAVRVLFDTDIPRALKGFVPLLNDKDPWFRSKALDAHRRWAVAMGPEALESLAKHRSIEARRCAANLLGDYKEDVSKIALMLVEDEDLTCKRQSAAALLASERASEHVGKFLSDEDPYLRRLAVASHGASESNRRDGLLDQHASVCEAAVHALTRNGEALDEASVLRLLKLNIEGTALIDAAIELDGPALIELAKHAKGPALKHLVKALRAACTSIDDSQIKTLLKAEQYVVLGRWLQGQRSEEMDQLRWRLLRESSVDSIERSRWLERLLGRCSEENLVTEARVFATEDHPNLLLDAAHNLSTAFDKLES